MTESNRNPKGEPTREEALLQAATQLSPAGRAAFLTAACQGDPALRDRLEALLSANEQTNTVLSTKPESALLCSEASAPQTRATIKADVADAPDEALGQTLGRYKLREKVGEGGCGVVYVAEQTEPMRRRVALKVIKLGMDTRAVVARFEAERQALAMMDHPNIAKVLDAGATDAGRPYFVMELVRGIRITDYCDQANLSTKERIDLFIKVCQAIQHAHQKGIIHRDIKPSNILVTLHDTVPVPKVIDFGIAKATEGRLTDATVYTQLHQFIGTPAYMSPEQAEMSGLDIDTRTDIYSLGVLLYELLAGSTPFDPKELIASGIDGMRQIIREKEPMPPSTRLATLQSDELTTTAKRRACDAPRLIHLLKGDLDWIVMKCLEKDRTRRYETTSGLAADLKRHLMNEPVVARPASAAYRFQKMVRRNKLVFAAASAVCLALISGFGFSTWSFLRERKAHAGEIAARRIADEQRQKAEARETEARLLLYEANMSLAQDAWAQNNIGRLRELLDDTRAFPDRGFEWFYWQQQTHQHVLAFRGDGSSVSSVAFSPDGRRLVTGGWLMARIWDVSGGKELLRLKGHSLMITSVAFSPDGLRIVTGSDDRTAKVWDSATGEALLTFREHTNPITSVAFSPDGRWVVSAAVDHTAKVWDAASGKELITLRDEDSFKINSVAFSPEGEQILTGGDSATRIWDIATAKPLFTISWSTLSAAFSPDGKRIVTGGMGLKVWDAASGKELNTLNGHGDMVLSAAFSPDGLRIVSGGLDNTARIWDAASGRELATFKGHTKAISSVAFSPDGRQIATTSYDSTAKLWEIPTGNSLTRLEPHGTASQHYMTFPAAFSLDGRRIITASREDTARIWDAVTGQELSAVVEAHNAITSLALSPDGQRFVAGLSASAKVYDAASGRELSTLVGHTAAILSAAFSHDGQRIVTHSLDGTAKVWEAASGRELFTLKGHSSRAPRADFSPPISEVVLSPDGRRILTRCEDRTANAWDGATGRQIFTLEHSDRISSLAFSPDSRYIVTGGRDNIAAIWDAVRGRELRKFAGHEQSVLSVAFSPNGERVLTGSLDGTARVWDAATGRVILTLKGHNNGVSSVAYSPDGRRILTGSADKTAKLWDALSGRELLTLSGHLGDVSFVAFSPNGHWIVTGRNGQVEKIWGAARPDQVAKWQAEETPVTQQ